MVSRKNIKYKLQQDAKRVPHYGIRKLSVGVASVLLGTVFYMQNGTAHADVNPTVSAGNNSVKVINENSGTDSSIVFSSMSNRAGSANSANSVVSTGGATNSMAVHPVSVSPVSPVESATSQVSHSAVAVSEPGSTTPASQVNSGANVVSNSIPVQNRPASAFMGFLSNGRLASNLKVNPSVLAVSKVASTGASNNAVNGGFDQSTWGTLDVSKWTGQENNGVYELTGYTGDLDHIIVPNSADFAKAGHNVGQVGISADTTHSWFVNGSPESIAFSKTDGQMVKAVGSNWTSAFTGAYDRNGLYMSPSSALTLFDGNKLDTSNITNMRYMFAHNKLTALSGVSNWKTDNVTDMSGMFVSNQISDLTPIVNWNTDNDMDMSFMFDDNQISELTALANWKTDNVANMSAMFINNQIAYADFTKWDFGKAQKLNQLGEFIYQSTPAIIIVKNADDQTLLSNSQVISTKQNQLHFGADTVDMPTVYVASDKADARQKILADIKTKLADYQKSHADVDIKPVKPLDQLTELVDLANAKFTVVKRTLSELDTNDAFALDPINGLHEHKNVNDNGGYDTDFWGTLDVSKFTTVKNGDNLEITGYTGDASKVIIPNIADFWANKLDQGAKQVTISSDVMHDLAKKATRIGLSKTNNQKVVAGDAIWSNAFGGLTVSPQFGVNGGMWVYNPKLTVMDLHNLDTTNITDMSSMFNGGGGNLKVIGDLSQWTTTNVTDMTSMFKQASKLTNIGDLDNWDTSKVTDMSWMFFLASALTNIGDLDNWDTSKVTDMSYMFSSASKLTNVGDLSKWNVSNVTNMASMFNCSFALTNIGDLSKWNTSKVTNMSWMFYQASALTNIGDLDNWDTSKVTDMSHMFSSASKLTNVGDLSKWDVSKVTNMSYMFNQAFSLTNIGDLSKWDISKVADMYAMFYSATALKQLNISNWDLTKLRDKGTFQSFVTGDPNLVVIANNVKLPTWYQNELSNSNAFWNDHLAVITNNETLLKASGSVDNVTVDGALIKRPVFYNSNGSADAVAVLKQANQAYSKQYQSEHLGYTLALASDVDQTDPIALANAKFVSVPLDVQFKLAYYDLTGNLIGATTSTHKVGETFSISPLAPVNYVLVNGQVKADYLMRWGLNEADFLVEPKVTQTTETKTVSRTIKVQTPDGQTQNVVQTVKFVRDGYLNQVTKQMTYSPWSFNGQYQFSSYQLKPIDGYTADVVSAVIVTPDSSDTMLSLAYHKIPAVYSVDYQLANGTVVANVVVTPGSDGRIQLTAPKGYRLLTSVNMLQAGFGSQTFVALVVPNEQTYTAKDTLPSAVKEPLTKTITRTVKITMPNGHVRTIKQQVKFTRTATTNPDGTVTYSNWQSIGRTQFNKVFVPKRRGYHLVITDASGKALADVEKINIVTADMSDSIVNVKYAE